MEANAASRVCPVVFLVSQVSANPLYLLPLQLQRHLAHETMWSQTGDLIGCHS